MRRILRIKRILCPVCENFQFGPLYEDELEDGLKEYDGFCSVCGWNYDEKQLKDFNLITSKNSKSINQYKDWLKKQLSINPKFNYLDSIKPDPSPHVCPICGKYKFKDLFSHRICPYCGWEDDGAESFEDDDYVGANGETFDEYKKKYEKLLKLNPKYKWKNEINKTK